MSSHQGEETQWNFLCCCLGGLVPASPACRSTQFTNIHHGRVGGEVTRRGRESEGGWGSQLVITGSSWPPLPPAPLGASRFPGAGVSLIKNRLSGRAHQLPADLRGCLMSNNTMSVTTFALSAPSEDGAYSKKENIFKIEASLLIPPPGFSCNFKALFGSLEVAVFLLQMSQERGQVGDLPNGTDHWDQLLSWIP